MWDPRDWAFETDRLRVVPWRSRGDAALAAFLTTALTDAVTRELPPTWEGNVVRPDPHAWIEARDAEGAMFLIETRAARARGARARDARDASGDASPVGFFMFFPEQESATSDGRTDGRTEVAATTSDGPTDDRTRDDDKPVWHLRIGYVLAEHAWGQGYASEIVVGFARRWDAAAPGATGSLIAGVTVGNAASQRVLDKAGFSSEGERGGVLVYRRVRP